MIGVILAAGNGSRLNSLSDGISKPLRKINNTYLIEFSLRILASIGVSQICIVGGRNLSDLKKALGFDYQGVKIIYIYQKQQKGIVNAFVQAEEYIRNKDCILMLADEIFINFKTNYFKKIITETNFNFYCGVVTESNPQKIKNNFSLDIDENNIIRSCTEKPSYISDNIKGTGFCYFRNTAVNILLKKYNSSINILNNLCDYINFLISKNIEGIPMFIADKEFNINTLSDLDEANELFNHKY